jgi:radical SAM protein with 4Fe4S-binding SPASM domain
MIRQISEWKPAPVLIMSGGEPLTRPDVFDLAGLARDLGVTAVLSTNGTLLDRESCLRVKASGLKRLSMSLDGPDAGSHDAFRGVPGAFASLVSASALLNEHGIPFQINSTVTPGNISQTEGMLACAKALGAVAFHVFLLVPVGRARDWAEAFPPAGDYEAALKRLKALEPDMGVEFKATCAPQYQRIARESGTAPPRGGKGCLGGQGFMFVAHDGACGACGYLPVSAGSLREKGIREIYGGSPLFAALRDKSRYRGKCAVCEYWGVCGGCRARAHAMGDYLGEEPLCPHVPKALSGAGPKREGGPAQGAARPAGPDFAAGGA